MRLSDCFKLYRYLELADWSIKDALRSVREDREWEKEEIVDDSLKSGQIGIRVNFNGGKASLNMKGAGQSPDRSASEKQKQKQKQKVVVHAKLPAIATKSVFAEDLYKVSNRKIMLHLSWIYGIQKNGQAHHPFIDFRHNRLHLSTTVLDLS